MRAKKVLCGWLGVKGSVWKKLCVKGSLCVLLCSKWRVPSFQNGERHSWLQGVNSLSFKCGAERTLCVFVPGLDLRGRIKFGCFQSNWAQERNLILILPSLDIFILLMTYNIWLAIGVNSPKCINIGCWNWVWPLIIWWGTSDRSNLYLELTPKVKLLCIRLFRETCCKCEAGNRLCKELRRGEIP